MNDEYPFDFIKFACPYFFRMVFEKI